MIDEQVIQIHGGRLVLEIKTTRNEAEYITLRRYHANPEVDELFSGTLSDLETTLKERPCP